MSNPPTTTPAVNVPTLLVCAAIVGIAVAVCWLVMRYRTVATDRPRRDWPGTLGEAAIVAAAAGATFHGLYSLARAVGVPWWVAPLLPLMLDGAALLTARAWVDTTLPARTRQYAAMIALLLAGGSILGNIASVLIVPAPPGAPTGVRVALAVVPPVALVLVGTLRHLVRENRNALAHAREQYWTAAEHASAAAEQLRQLTTRRNHADWVAQRLAQQRAVTRYTVEAMLADLRRVETAARAALDRHERDTRESAERIRVDAVAAERFAVETAAYAEDHRRQADASAAAEEDARRRECNARDERARLAAEHQPVTPARTPARKRGGNARSRQRGRQPEPLADLVARARPILAAEDLGRPALAERLGCTQDRARKVLEAINGEQSDASPDPLEEAWSAPASDAPEHTVSGHPVSATAGGEQ